MTRWSNEDSAGSGMFLLGALAGALVGAGVALLMAPKTGAAGSTGSEPGLQHGADAAARRYRDIADKAHREDVRTENERRPL